MGPDLRYKILTIQTGEIPTVTQLTSLVRYLTPTEPLCEQALDEIILGYTESYGQTIHMSYQEHLLNERILASLYKVINETTFPVVIGKGIRVLEMISNDGGEDNRIHTNYDTLVSNKGSRRVKEASIEFINELLTTDNGRSGILSTVEVQGSVGYMAAEIVEGLEPIMLEKKIRMAELMGELAKNGVAIQKGRKIVEVGDKIVSEGMKNREDVNYNLYVRLQAQLGMLRAYIPPPPTPEEPSIPEPVTSLDSLAVTLPQNDYVKKEGNTIAHYVKEVDRCCFIGGELRNV